MNEDRIGKGVGWEGAIGEFGLMQLRRLRQREDRRCSSLVVSMPGLSWFEITNNRKGVHPQLLYRTH